MAGAWSTLQSGPRPRSLCARSRAFSRCRISAQTFVAGSPLPSLTLSSSRSLNRVAPIQLYLEKQFQENAARTEEQVYQRSIELEPRETEAVRVTRCVPDRPAVVRKAR